MGTLEYIKKAEKGKIVIEVPHELNGKEFKVSVSALKDFETSNENCENWHLLSGSKKLEILKRFEGKAKYPDVEINKYDVYEQ